jgi:hypothetical protein
MRACRRWTEKEIAYLEKQAGVLPAEAIARRLKRSCSAVSAKALSLGLSTRPTLDSLNARALAETLGVNHQTVKLWIRWGYLGATKRGEHERARWCVTLENFKAFYSAYGAKLPSLKAVDREAIDWLLGGR